MMRVFFDTLLFHSYLRLFWSTNYSTLFRETLFLNQHRKYSMSALYAFPLIMTHKIGFILSHCIVKYIYYHFCTVWMSISFSFIFAEVLSKDFLLTHFLPLTHSLSQTHIHTHMNFLMCLFFKQLQVMEKKNAIAHHD